MTYKICMAVFSTNRIPYITRTLKSQDLLDTRHCEVTKIFFDDYPNGRNNTLVEMLAKSHGYTHINLHRENQGITRTWQELFNFVKAGNFDYVWHQEDDAEIMYPIRFIDLIEILQENPNLSQVQLRRDNWYHFETEPIGPKASDQIWRNYRIERDNPYFWMMSSFYPAWIAKEFDHKKMNGFPSEATVANFMLQKNGSTVGLLKTAEGGIMVNHFGEYTRGSKVAPGELGWENFSRFDPNVDYDSKTGYIYQQK